VRLLAFALGGTATAIALALVGRGDLLFAAFTLVASGLGLGAAFVIALVAYARGRSRRAFRLAGTLALLFSPLLLALPLGWAVNAFDVVRAKAWCEGAVERADTTAPRPSLVHYDGGWLKDCTVLDRTSFMGWWVLQPGGTWYYAD